MTARLFQRFSARLLATYGASATATRPWFIIEKSETEERITLAISSRPPVTLITVSDLITVTVLAFANPSSVLSGSHGDCASFSAMHSVYLPACESPASATAPGHPPPILRIIN